MLTLDTYHIVPLILAVFITFTLYFSYWGLSKKGLFLESFCLFPIIICAVSIFTPFVAVKILTYIVLLYGIFNGIRKLCSISLKEHCRDFLKYYRNSKTREKFLIWFCVIHILSGIIGATVLGGEGAVVDAMTYHLGAPKEWALFLDGPKLSLINPESLTGSYYEYLLYPLFLVAKPLYEYLAPLSHTGHELLSYTLLLSGQLFSVAIAMLFIPRVLLSLYRNKMTLFYIILITILGMKGMNWVWKTAKNDAFPLLCCLVSYRYLLCNYKNSVGSLSRTILVSFLILGVGLGAKMTNLYPMLFILTYMFFSNIHLLRREFSSGEIVKYTSIAAGAGLLALFPFLLRNFLETSNPFYPTSSFLFKNIYLTDATEAFHKLYSHPTTWENSFEKLQRLFVYSPGFILITVVSLYFKKWKEVIFFTFSMLVISKITGERFMWRQISMIIFFIVIWGRLLFNYWERNKSEMPKYCGRVIVILVLAVSQFKPERLFKYPVRHYFEVVRDVMPRNYTGWNEQLKENLDHRGEEDFYSNYSSYYSRFRHLNLTDSRPEFREERVRN